MLGLGAGDEWVRVEVNGAVEEWYRSDEIRQRFAERETLAVSVEPGSLFAVVFLREKPCDIAFLRLVHISVLWREANNCQ